MSPIPDLTRMAAEAAQGPQDPWAVFVGISSPTGPQQVPITIGIFVMLDAIASRLERICVAAETLAAQELTR